MALPAWEHTDQCALSLVRSSFHGCSWSIYRDDFCWKLTDLGSICDAMIMFYHIITRLPHFIAFYSLEIRLKQNYLMFVLVRISF